MPQSYLAIVYNLLRASRHVVQRSLLYMAKDSHEVPVREHSIHVSLYTESPSDLRKVPRLPPSEPIPNRQRTKMQ